MNDLVHFVCYLALRRFGVGDTFNAAGFAAAWAEVTGIGERLDGRHVRAMLTGRPDIEILGGESHFRLLAMNAVARRYQSAWVAD